MFYSAKPIYITGVLFGVILTMKLYHLLVHISVLCFSIFFHIKGVLYTSNKPPL